MIKRTKGAVVLNDSDQFFVGKPNSFVYGMTKGAIGQIAQDRGRHGARHLRRGL